MMHNNNNARTFVAIISFTLTKYERERESYDTEEIMSLLLRS